MNTPHTDPAAKTLAFSDELITLTNVKTDTSLPDVIRRLEVKPAAAGPVRLSAEISTLGVTGVQGIECSVFFNIEYVSGPVFWDTFFYPDTGTAPWRDFCIDVRDRGAISAIEMHIRFHGKGTLKVRNVKIESIPAWPEDAQVNIAVFGDSTDMTCYLPHERRLTKHLEILLRDRFPENRIDVHGLAEGGETAKRIVESGRLERELKALPGCDIAMIRYGLNDEGRKIDPLDFANYMRQACDLIHKHYPKATVVLSTTIPCRSEKYDEQTIKVARERGLMLIPIFDVIDQRSRAGDWDWHHQPLARVGRRRTANTPENPTGLLGDKHPNFYGAQMIAESYFEHLEPVVAKLLG